MFYHGIDREYVYRHYPVLSPRRSVSAKDVRQLRDRLHLIQQFGIEPIHLLEERDDFPRERCVAECLAFGDTVFAFHTLPEPLWQLSPHEVGVPVLDLRQASEVYMSLFDARLRILFPHANFYLAKREHSGKRGCFSKISTL